MVLEAVPCPDGMPVRTALAEHALTDRLLALNEPADMDLWRNDSCDDATGEIGSAARRWAAAARASC